MKPYIYGIDIGGTTVKFGLFDQAGTLIRKWSIETDVSEQGRQILTQIVDEIKSQPESLNMIEGVGFGVPGPVKNNVVEHAVNLGWKTIDVAKVFLESLGELVAVTVHNDANLAALGEQAYGCAKAYEDVVMFTLGTGVGGGVIVGGSILEGANGAAGEIGHMKMSAFNFPCGCGNQGCLETVASATGVKRLVEYYVNQTPLESLLRDESYYSAKYVFELAKEDDPMALKVVDDVALALAEAAQMLSLVTNPEAFVFGGGLSNAGDYLIDQVRAHFEKIAFSSVKNTKFILAELGNDAGIYGALRAVKHRG